MKKKIIVGALRLFLWWVLLLWCKTLRIRIIGGERTKELEAQRRNYVIAFWHGSMVLGWFLHRPTKGKKVSALVSQSSDGEFLSTVLERWKYSMIRGSSHIGGTEAMQLMVDAVSSGSSLAITPDGPRGPRHAMKMGAVRVAQKTGVPLILCGIALRKKRILRSWDKFEVPVPFSTVTVMYGEPVIVPKELQGESLDKFKVEMQNRLNGLCEEAERSL